MINPDGTYKFTAKEFWYLIEELQDYRCKLTNVSLNELNTTVELRNPKIPLSEGRGELENHYVIDKALAPLARKLTEDEIINYAIKIVQYRGAEKGYKVVKIRSPK